MRQIATLHFGTGKASTKVNADLMAIHKVLLHISDKPAGQVVILTDSMTALQRTQGDVGDALTQVIPQELTLSVPRVALQ